MFEFVRSVARHIRFSHKRLNFIFCKSVNRRNTKPYVSCIRSCHRALESSLYFLFCFFGTKIVKYALFFGSKRLILEPKLNVLIYPFCDVRLKTFLIFFLIYMRDENGWLTGTIEYFYNSKISETGRGFSARPNGMKNPCNRYHFFSSRTEKGTRACASTVFFHLSKHSQENLRFAPGLKLSM